MVGYACKFWLFHREESAQVYGVTERRAQQLIKMHRDTGAPSIVYREGETLEEAFLRRAPPEAMLGLFRKEDKRYA